MTKLIECVPNFSEGRRPAVYTAIVDAIAAVEGVTVLDWSADTDHNRTVVTFVGAPAAVAEGVVQGVAVAKKLINLDTQSGEHPRMGAADVVPLIPLAAATFDDCIALAHTIGQRLGEELDVPVYLYGKAATRPGRETAGQTRRGEYERWKESVASDPLRVPDYGLAAPRPYGATLVGVRDLLVAYNLFLNTDSVATARAIAKAVRASSGGLGNVMAKGFLVRGQAQVSMNLLDFRETPLHRVQEAVKTEAARYGVRVMRAELIGMMPQQALLDSARWYLQLDAPDSRILELRIAEQKAQAGLAGFVDAVAATHPVPAGGAVSAMAGALAAALSHMVAGITVGRKSYADHDAEMRTVQAESAHLLAELRRLIAADVAAYEAYMAAETPAARADAMQAATAVPLAVARHALAVARLAKQATAHGNKNAVTDAAIAGMMARTAVQTAAMTVRINTASTPDTALLSELHALETEAETLSTEMNATAALRGGFGGLQ